VLSNPIWTTRAIAADAAGRFDPTCAPHQATTTTTTTTTTTIA
jgi:hypothetical protein